MTNKLELARKLYAEVKGNEETFVSRALVEIPLSLMGCKTYFQNLKREQLLEEGWLKNPQPLVLGSATRVIDIGSEPVKRTVIVMLEMELTEEEDTYLTAELAVDLLNQNLSNDVKLVAATEKANG